MKYVLILDIALDANIVSCELGKKKLGKIDRFRAKLDTIWNGKLIVGPLLVDESDTQRQCPDRSMDCATDFFETNKHHITTRKSDL